MTSTLDLPVARFLQTLEIVAKEGGHLTYSLILIETFNRLRQDAMIRMGHKSESLPEQLILPGQV